MTDIEQTLGEIRRRDAMYPTQELTAGPVNDRRTLLNIIDQLQNEIQAMIQVLKNPDDYTLITPEVGSTSVTMHYRMGGPPIGERPAEVPIMDGGDVS